MRHFADQSFIGGSPVDYTPPAPSITFTYVGFNSNTANNDTYTFSSEPIGSASSDRVVLVLASGSDDNNTTDSAPSVTLGGVSMNVGRAQAGSRYQPFGLFYLLVTSGTTADIVVSFTSSVNRRRCCIHVATLTGGTFSVHSHDDERKGFGQTVVQADLTPPSGSIVVLGANKNSDSTGSSGKQWGWSSTNGASITEVSDENIESNRQTTAFAYTEDVDGSADNFIATFGVSVNGHIGVVGAVFTVS